MLYPLASYKKIFLVDKILLYFDNLCKDALLTYSGICVKSGEVNSLLMTPCEIFRPGDNPPVNLFLSPK